MQEIVNSCKKRLEENGIRALQGTNYCKQHQENFPNCKGCESNEGCHRLAKMLTVISFGLMSSDNGSFQDMLESVRYTQDMIDKLSDPEVNAREIRVP